MQQIPCTGVLCLEMCSAEPGQREVTTQLISDWPGWIILWICQGNNLICWG